MRSIKPFVFGIPVTLAALFAVLYLCGAFSSVIPPGYIAKKIGINGVQPEIYETGRVTILPFSRQRLVYIETASELRKAPVKVIMADPTMDKEGNVEDRLGLDMDFLINIRYSLRADDDIITAMLRDTKLGTEGDQNIAVRTVYSKYGDMVVGRVAREVLGAYTPEQVLGNLETINKTLDAKIKEALAKSPLRISSVSLGPITLPKVITDRIKANKDTELSEVQKRAEQKIALLNKTNEIELAEQQAVREKIDAESLAAQNGILNKSITPEVLRLRELQIQEKQIDMMRESLNGGNNNTVFIPYGAMDSAGAQMRMFQK